MDFKKNSIEYPPPFAFSPPAGYTVSSKGDGGNENLRPAEKDEQARPKKTGCGKTDAVAV